MYQTAFPIIDPVATGHNILRLRKERGLSVKDLQVWFGFDEPQAIYKWQRGESLPCVDNLYALGALFGVSMNDILIAKSPIPKTIEQQATPAALIFLPAAWDTANLVRSSPFLSVRVGNSLYSGGRQSIKPPLPVPTIPLNAAIFLMSILFIFIEM